MAKKRNPQITVHEVNCYAWSTWQGVNGDLGTAIFYNAIVAKECNFNHMDNEDGFGYSGALWECIWRLSRKAGYNPTKYWCRKHRYTVNRVLAKRFDTTYFLYGPEEAVKRWHRGAHYKLDAKSRREAVKYWNDIKVILRSSNGQ